MNLGGIFDDGEAVFFSRAEERIHIYRMAIDVYRHDGARARSDLLLDLADIHAPRLRIAVDEDRNTAAVDHGKGARNYGESGDDDFVAGFEVQTLHGNLECGSPVADRNAVFPPAVRRPLLLELVNESAC